MAMTVIVSCDGQRCSTTASFKFGHIDEGDLPTVEWNYDQDNEKYYCPECSKKMILSGTC